MKNEIIKDHSELAKKIEGKGILHLNSLGKDSAVCLEWLVKYARPSKIVSVNFKFISEHPYDNLYMKYQKKRYPEVEFITEPNPHELTNIGEGVFQCPIAMLNLINSFEHYGFSMTAYSDDLLEEYNLDYICLGLSRYESVSRASTFHKKGILRGTKIYPIGMMSKKEIFEIIKKCDIKLHPCYKFAMSTYDNPSYYKMRAGFITNKDYKKSVLAAYPLLALDIYRYEKLFKKEEQ